MKSLIDILTWVVGLAATVFAVYQFYKFANFPVAEGGHTHLWLAIGATVVAFICALIFFVRRVNKEEEIHITQ
jgi:heme exporter protein D